MSVLAWWLTVLIAAWTVASAVIIAYVIVKTALHYWRVTRTVRQIRALPERDH